MARAVAPGPPPARRRLVELAVLFTAIVCSAWLRAQEHGHLRMSILWLPTGFAVAGLWFLGWRAWPVVSLAAATVRLLTGGGWLAILSAALGSTLEALLGVFLLRRLCVDARLARLRDVVALLAVAALAPGASVLTAWLTRLTTDVFRGQPVHAGLDGWWLMNTLGVLVVVPLTGSWAWLGSTFRQRGARVEAAALSALLVAMVGATLAGDGAGPLALQEAYLLLPVSLLAGLRFGPRGAALSSSLGVLAVIVATTLGTGPFLSVPLQDRHVALQVFSLSLVGVPLVFGALIAERDAAATSKARVEAAKRALQACLPDITYRIRSDETILDVSLPAGSMPLAGATAVAGRGLEALEPALAEAMRAALRSPGNGASPAAHEFRTRDGRTTRHCELRAVRLDAEEVLCLVRDITERKRAEQVLAWEASVLGTIARGRPSGEALAAILAGLEREIEGGIASILLLEGERLHPLLGPGLPAEYTARLEGVVIGPSVGSCGTAAFRRETVVVSDIATDPKWSGWAELALGHGLRACWSVPILGSAGQVLGTFAIYYREPRTPLPAELALVERAASLGGIALEREHNEHLLSSLTRNVTEGLFRSTLDRGLVYANLAMMRMFGYDSIEELLRVDPVRFYDDPTRREELTRLSLERGSVAGEEVLFRRRDGSTFWGSVASNTVRAADGTLFFDGVVSDVTAHKRLQEDLRQAQKLEAVGRLAGGVAHDFNNLLTVIGGHAEALLQRFREDPAGLESATAIVGAVERAAGVTQQLLTFGRRQAIAPEVLELGTLVDHFATLLRRLLREDIALEIEHHDAALRVRADRRQLEQVLLNLVVNARDALPVGGRIRIVTEAVELDPDFVRGHENARAGAYVRLGVEDTGSGMDEPTRARALEPFFTTKEPGRGTGLGLATVYGIVRQSEGLIVLDSAPGSGTRVSVFLPRTEEPAPASRERPVRCEESTSSATVLVAEDEELVRQILLLTLREAGYSVLAAEHAEQALALASATSVPIDLLVTDLTMRGMGGVELAAELRRERPELRVLFVSGYGGEALRGGLPAASQFLQKPFARAELLARARALLETTEASLVGPA